MEKDSSAMIEDVSTMDTKRMNFADYFNKAHKPEKEDLVCTNLIDDTGYSALSLPTDDFLNKLMIIKHQMRSVNHPLTEFIICFDKEFWESYSFYSNG